MRIKLKPLHKQVLVITGASSGIGLTIAAMAARKGAALMLVSRNEEALRGICDELRTLGARVEYAVADVADRAAMERVVEQTIEHFGGFDTWINDAGVGVYADLMEIEEQDHRRLFETNYWGVVNGTQLAAGYLKEHGGAIINIGSVLSDVATTPLGAYAASKHAVKGFTDAFRMEMIQQKAPVSITLIKPSGIDSPFSDHARNYMHERARVPPMVYTPETVARAVLYAAAHPTRDIIVGSSGRMIIAFARLAPSLADRFYAWVLPYLHKDSTRPPVPTDNLQTPGEDGRRRSDHRFVRKHSFYTAAQRHPAVTLGLGALAGLALTAWWAQRNGKLTWPQRRTSHWPGLPLATGAAAGWGLLQKGWRNTRAGAIQAKDTVAKTAKVPMHGLRRRSRALWHSLRVH